jgi:hypothetical protein
MQFNIPPDLEILVRKRLESGGFSSVEDVFRRALEAQDENESWTQSDRYDLDRKIERSLQQVADGKVYGAEEARDRLAALRDKHPADR